MKIDILTIFPEMFEGIINNSIIKRAIEKDIVKINVIDFREYTTNKHNKVDDTTYGGGNGMLIAIEPIVNCLKSIDGYEKAYRIITSPTGEKYSQTKAIELSKKEHLIIICGHYEGIDSRIDNYVDQEISIGDYILTGGELAGGVIIDSVIRLLKGAITEGSLEDESFNDGLLEYPQFTKPAIFDGYKVPECLVNGNHEEIRKYRLYESLRKTYNNRPDLLANREFTYEESIYMEYIKKGLDYEEFFKLNIKIKEPKAKKRNN